MRTTPYKFLSRLWILAAAAAMFAAATTASAAIIDVEATGSKIITGGAKTSTLSFNAGADADMLIVQLSSEAGGATSSDISITYNGVELKEAVSVGGRARGIWYLDSPFSGGAADLTVDMTSFSVVNGIAFGAVSVSSDLPGIRLHATATDDGITRNAVTITTTVDDSFIVTGYASNTPNDTITLPGDHTELYNSTNIGSAHGAAGYVTNNVAAGSHTYTYVDSDPQGNNTLAAAFVAVPEPSSIAIWIGLLSVGFVGYRQCLRARSK